METKILTTADEDLKIAADILKNGGNVIFPTETVYGLGADATNVDAIKNIFRAKGRPSDNPLIVHISDVTQLDAVVTEVPDRARTLMDKFWPGPLTIILPKSDKVPYATTGGLDTVAVRMPSSETARRLIELAGIPVAAPSANISGKPSPTTAKHCTDDMNGRVDAIVCGEACEVGVESTVLDMSGNKAVILRPGRVTAEELSEVLGEVEVAVALRKGEKPKSPGLKYKHYSPDAEVVILSGDMELVEAYAKEKAKSKKTGMLSFDEFPLIEGIKTISLGSAKKPQEAARKLFWALREMDDDGIELVLAPEIPDKDIWSAVRNRLYRAAGERVIKLPTDKKKVLFVCTGNTCRSPMAEAIFNNIAEQKGINATAESAGIFADGSAVSANATAAMSEIGIDISAKKSRQITSEMISGADVVLTMSGSHKAMLSAVDDGNKIFTLADFVGEVGDISDPFGGTIEVYRACRDEISELIEKAIEKL